MLAIITTAQFKRDARRMARRGKDPGKLQAVINRLVNQESLEARHRDHKLTGNYQDYRECHIEADWLLVYRTTPTELYLVRMGTHADLFKE